MKTLKKILNSVLGQSGFLQEDAFTTSQDPAQIQMVAIANRAAEEIRNYYPWHALRRAHSITLQAGVLEYDLPEDFDQVASESMWRQDDYKGPVFPTSNREWTHLIAGSPGVAHKYYARLQGGKLVFAGVTAGDVVTFDYQSAWAVLDANGSLKEHFTADTDQWILYESTLELATKAYWKMEKEIMSGPLDMQSYIKHRRHDITRDTGAKAIRPCENATPYNPPVANVPVVSA